MPGIQWGVSSKTEEAPQSNPPLTPSTHPPPPNSFTPSQQQAINTHNTHNIFNVVRVRIGTPQEHSVQQCNTQKDGPRKHQSFSPADTKTCGSKKNVHQTKSSKPPPQIQHATTTTAIVKTSQTSQIHRNEQQHSKQRQ